MAIKVNGTTINYVNVNGTRVNTVKVNGTVVYEIVSKLSWDFVGQSSSEPYYDLLINAYLNGDYSNGFLRFITGGYPADDYYEGFVAVIYDLSTQDYFEYVVVESFVIEG